MKKILMLLAVVATAQAGAQTKAFSYLDVGVTGGSMGLGVDVATPLCDYVRVRTGFTYMPHFSIKSDFAIETGDGSPISQSGLDKMTEMMSNITNMKIDDKVRMELEPRVAQYKLMVDVMPFKNNKHWNFTVGFYLGGGRIGQAVNVLEDAPTLLGVTMYNYFYTNSCQQKSIFGDIQLGDMDLPHVELSPKYLKKGMLGMPLGTFKDGSKAMLVPDENGIVQAEMEVDRFRPYVGLGYTTALSRDGRWNFALDAGVMMWGGKPKVYVDNVYKIDTENIDPDNYKYDIVRPNEEGTGFIVDEPLDHVDMIRDLTGIHGKVGDMVKAAKHVKCYPNLSVTFSYRIGKKS